MLHTSLRFLTHELNEHLKLRTGTTDSGDDKIFLTNVATENGVMIPDNSLGLSLINIEEERIFKDQKGSRKNGRQVDRLNPEIKLNLYVLITAYFQGS
ncbi:MAG: Pvc16 family protein, partial [Balneolales bacterium]